MRRMIAKLLEQYGTDVELGERTVRALFQPVTGSLERLAVKAPEVTGCASGKRYVYIGPVEPLPEEDGVLTVAGKAYRIRTAQHVNGTNGPAYSWAMCVEKGREDTWGMNSWKR